MGNQSANTHVQNQIAQLKVIKKESHYTILQALDQKQYIKFLYAPVSAQMNTSPPKSKKISIFDNKYLEYRWDQQQNHNLIKGLPKIWVFGEDPETESLISCTRSKLNFVIFEHPTLTLKQEIEKRVSLNHSFKEFELLTLIKSVVSSLSEFYDHTTNWNPENSQKNMFLVTEDNIFIDSRGQYVLSDIIGYLHQLEHLSKHEVTLKRQNRVNSLTNLHAKTSIKKIKANYFQANLQNLASIIDGILFRFTCFNQGSKATQESSSLSTALSTYRSATKEKSNFSLDFQILLKDLKEQCCNPQMIIEKADKILNAIHLPTPIERSSEICFKNEIIQEMGSSDGQNSIEKVSQALNFLSHQHRTPFNEVRESKEDSLQIKFDKILFEKQRTNIDSRFMKIKTDQTLHFTNIQLGDCKQSQKKNMKIRLSLKKSDNAQNLSQRKQNVSSGKPISKNEEKNINLNSKKTEPKEKENINLLKSENSVESKFKKGSNRSSCEKTTAIEKIMKVKLLNSSNQINNGSLSKNLAILKSQSIQNQSGNKKSLQEHETTAHMNPITRKKTFKMTGKPQNANAIEKAQRIYRTNLKTQELGIDGIENLSSIVSNQNNTMSSYGIPTTEEFKTEDSMIEMEGCVQFNENDDSDVLIEEKISNEAYHEQALSKKPQIKSSTSCVKLSSYQCLTEQDLYPHSEERIPDFLKQYKLPQKNLMTLNNIILKQKDVIVEESFEQSEINSIRHSYPNVLSFEYS